MVAPRKIILTVDDIDGLSPEVLDRFWDRLHDRLQDRPLEAEGEFREAYQLSQNVVVAEQEKLWALGREHDRAGKPFPPVRGARLLDYHTLATRELDR